MKKYGRRAAALALAAALFAGEAFPAFAADNRVGTTAAGVITEGGSFGDLPGLESEPADGESIPTEETVIGVAGYGYTPEQWARLMDNVMEYDEIPDLVHNFNSTITTVWDDLEDTQQKLEKSVIELQSQKRLMSDMKERAITDGDVSGAATYAVNEAVFAAVVSGLTPTVNSMLVSRSTRASVTKVEETITQVVQSLMIAYDSLTKQRDTLSALAEMYEAQYELAAHEEELGLVTRASVLAAQNNMLSAQSSIAALESGMAQLLPTLCTMAGWPADANPVIAPIPETDVSRIAAMNLEADTVKAIGNNTTLISQRTSAAGETYAEITARNGWINEGDEKLTIIMKELYDDVIAKETAFEAAKTGWAAAQRTRQTNDHMYDLGMLSKSEYLATQVSYYQEKASYEAADTSLLLAIETYNWAVLGLVSID